MYVAMCCKLRSRIQDNTVIIWGMKIGNEMHKISFLFISLPCPHVRLYQNEWIPAKGFIIVSCNRDSTTGDQLSACQTSVHLCLIIREFFLKFMFRRSVI